MHCLIGGDKHILSVHNQTIFDQLLFRLTNLLKFLFLRLFVVHHLNLLFIASQLHYFVDLQRANHCLMTWSLNQVRVPYLLSHCNWVKHTSLALLIISSASQYRVGDIMVCIGLFHLHMVNLKNVISGEVLHLGVPEPRHHTNVIYLRS